jgi:hypothetical protein
MMVADPVVMMLVTVVPAVLGARRVRAAKRENQRQQHGGECFPQV